MARRLPLLQMLMIVPLMVALWGFIERAGYSITIPLLMYVVYRLIRADFTKRA